METKLEVNKLYKELTYDKEIQQPMLIKIVHIMPKYTDDDGDENPVLTSEKTAIGIPMRKVCGEWEQVLCATAFLYDSEYGTRRDDGGIHMLVDADTDEKVCKEYVKPIISRKQFEDFLAHL